MLNSHEKLVEQICRKYTNESIQDFLRKKNNRFEILNVRNRDLETERFTEVLQVGSLRFEKGTDRVQVYTIRTSNELSEKSCRKAQYELAVKLLKRDFNSAGIFVFYDADGYFRFSLVYQIFRGRRSEISDYKRNTYYVSPDLPNKSFIHFIGNGDFSSLEKIKEAFSISAVTEEFYNEFDKQYNQMASTLQAELSITEKQAKDYCLLFTIRVVFIGFLQKKRWLDNNERFLIDCFNEYQSKLEGTNTFYHDWMEPLFFEAFNQCWGTPVHHGYSYYSEKTINALKDTPYLNGGLFSKRHGFDDQGWYIPDSIFHDFIEFLFSYHFTIEENTLYDEELELNPEFLGIIFERLVNYELGAIYTPRTEVDLMCRLCLVKWLEQSNTTGIDVKDLYELFFREKGLNNEDCDQKDGDFSERQYRELLSLIEHVAICDPAVGSGAFPVGMLHILDELETHLHEKLNHFLSDDNAYLRKKRIIGRSLYGVELKEWAVWITQLRLWITLLIDAPESMRQSSTPLLPSLDFKIRCGDSLVQRIGTKNFPVTEISAIGSDLIPKLKHIRQMKIEFYESQAHGIDKIKHEEYLLFTSILNAEIYALEKKKKWIQRDTVSEQEVMFDELQEEKQEIIDFTQVEIKELDEKIADLQSEKRLVSEQHPLIWNIEFAEIFGEKGGFDIIIGNPPYVRQEKIQDYNGKLNPKEYKAALLEMVRDDYDPKISDIAKFKSQWQANAQSDLYVYFYFRSLKLLNPKGILTFICSNSWLDAGYGVWLQKFLLEQKQIHFIMENRVMRSFERADVNTIITVIGNTDKLSSKKRKVRFVSYKKPFEEVTFTENFLDFEKAEQRTTTDDYRVVPLSNQVLLKESTVMTEYENKPSISKYEGDKWGGKYLRAPDIYFTILEKGKDKFVKLSDIADIRRGFTTGANEFFYPSSENIRKFGIEKEFLKPVLKSPRECKKILINPVELSNLLFMCNKSKKELIGTGALKYIEWGEKKGYNRRKSCNGISWYRIKSTHNGQFAWAMIHANQHSCYINLEGVELDHRLFEIISKKVEEQMIVSAYGISIFGALNKEIVGKLYGGGSGPIATDGIDIEQMIFLRPEFVTWDAKEKKIFDCAIQNEPMIVIDNQLMNTNPELDNIFFDALELTEEERKDVYRGVCQLVWERISRARSLGKNARATREEGEGEEDEEL